MCTLNIYFVDIHGSTWIYQASVQLANVDTLVNDVIAAYENTFSYVSHEIIGEV